MEYTARITQEFKLDNLWKYEFLDVQTNKEDFFYHDKQIDYNPNVAGKLNLTRDKFFLSFEKEVNKLVGAIEEIGDLVNYEEETKKIFEKTIKRLPKRQIEVSPQKFF